MCSTASAGVEGFFSDRSDFHRLSLNVLPRRDLGFRSPPHSASSTLLSFSRFPLSSPTLLCFIIGDGGGSGGWSSDGASSHL